MATYSELVQLTMEEAGVQQELPPDIALGSGIGMLSDFEQWVATAYIDIQTLHDQWDFNYGIHLVALQEDKFVYDVSQQIPDFNGVHLDTNDNVTYLTMNVVDSNGNVTQTKIAKYHWREWRNHVRDEYKTQTITVALPALPANGERVVVTSSSSATDPEGIVIQAEDLLDGSYDVKVLVERGLFSNDTGVEVGGEATAITGVEMEDKYKGSPDVITFDPDGLMHVSPVPDGDYTYIIPMDYTKDVDEFDIASPDAEAIIPDEFKMVIVYKALNYYYEYMTNSAGYQSSLNKYKHWINKMGNKSLPDIDFNYVELY